MTGCSGKCCFGVMYCEWYGVCDFVMLSVVVVRLSVHVHFNMGLSPRDS